VWIIDFICVYFVAEIYLWIWFTSVAALCDYVITITLTCALQLEMLLCAVHELCVFIYWFILFIGNLLRIRNWRVVYLLVQVQCSNIGICSISSTSWAALQLSVNIGFTEWLIVVQYRVICIIVEPSLISWTFDCKIYFVWKASGTRMSRKVKLFSW